MPRITADGETFETADGTRLVLALEEHGIDVSHRCGGHAKCTTCRVSFSDGEPEQMTRAEFEKLGDDRGEYRLSCQVACDRDMTLDVLMKVSDMDWDDAGGAPEATITPEPTTYPVSELTSES